jgi:AcrR family transcriptional regulator
MNMIEEKRKPSARILRKRHARTQEILDFAQAIVAEAGLEGLTIPALARQMDASVGATYRYFANKQALVVALQLRAIEAFDHRLMQVLDEVPDPGLGAVVGAAHAWRAFAVEEPAMHGLIDAMLSAPARILEDVEASLVQEGLDRVLDTIQAGMATAQEEGELTEGSPRLRTHVLWASLHGVDHFRKRDGRIDSALHSDRVAEAVLADLLRGWGASEAALIYAGAAQ